MANDNYENLGFQVKVDGADSAVSNLDRIVERLEKINQLQGKKVSTSKQVVNAQKKEEKQIKRNTQSLTSYLGKLTSTVVIARKFARVISSAIQESANYVENLNLFAVAYGDVYKETLGWALDLADGFGLANNEVLKFAGTFRQLSTSLGLVEDTANSVSKTVTQLGYDMSALFNTSVENAMEKLQSGLFSGNVRPLRSYGIDISQNQIDALFETNATLASLGVNARNLSQSDKVLARLIITLRDGSNAFGTMNREINTLQSQIRILQGSFSNFKLAIGDLVHEPLRQALVYVNAFIMAMTNVIRLFKPLKTTDENNMLTSTAMGAEEASDALDKLNGKLADFDKFNVLGGQSGGNSNLAVTEALTAELEKQQKLYEDQVKAMEKVENEAKVLSETMLKWFVVLDENGKFVEWTDNFKPYLEILKQFIAIAKTVAPIALNVVKSIAQIVQKVIEFTDKLKITDNLIRIIIAYKLITRLTGLNSIIGKVAKAIPKLNARLKETRPAVTGLNAAFMGLSVSMAAASLGALWASEASSAEKLADTFIGLGAAITVAAIAMAAFKQNWAQAIALGATVAAGYWTVSSLANGFADGGYTNANLIMTHENGKREWVGKAAGSSAIVNDTQMSDIMEVAVAKGVYNALSARSAMGSGGSTNETIVVKIGEEEVFNAVRKTARRQGRDFANV